MSRFLAAALRPGLVSKTVAPPKNVGKLVDKHLSGPLNHGGAMKEEKRNLAKEEVGVTVLIPAIPHKDRRVNAALLLLYLYAAELLRSQPQRTGITYGQ